MKRDLPATRWGMRCCGGGSSNACSSATKRRPTAGLTICSRFCASSRRKRRAKKRGSTPRIWSRRPNGLGYSPRLLAGPLWHRPGERSVACNIGISGAQLVGEKPLDDKGQALEDFLAGLVVYGVDLLAHHGADGVHMAFDHRHRHQLRIGRMGQEAAEDARDPARQRKAENGGMAFDFMGGVGHFL